MAFTNKPFIWKNNGVTPPETLQNSGFIGGKKLPAPYVNAQWTATYKAIEELQRKAGEVKTINNVLPNTAGNISVTKSTVGLSNVDNTSDVNKPISNATKTELDKKYTKPTAGIPKTDLSADVQTSLTKAESALQSVPLATAALDGLMAKSDKVSLDNVMSVFANLQKMKITNDDGSAIYTIGVTLPSVKKGIFHATASTGTYAPPASSVEGIIIAESASYWNFIGASDSGTWCVATYQGSWKGWTTLATAKDVSNLSTRITALETSDTTHQADNTHIFNVDVTYAASVYTVTNAPTFTDYLTARFKAPNSIVDTATFKIGTDVYTMVNADFELNEIVIVTFDKAQKKVFFKRGGGENQTLPPQLTSFTANYTGLSGQLKLDWTISNTTYLNDFLFVYKTGSYPNSSKDGTQITASKTARTLTISGLVNGTTYYVRAYPRNAKKQLQTDYKVTSGSPIIADDLKMSPGPTVLMKGTMQEGYFGLVSSSELITGDTLASLVGLTAGTSQFSTTNWLKFAHKGKVLFVAQKPIRHSLSWDNINSVGAATGTKQVAIKSLNYKVRLLQGALTNPSENNATDRGAKGSEWNRLMLAVHEQVENKYWAYPAYVESDIQDFGTYFTDADLITNSSFGNGSYSWCQETAKSDSSDRVIRGYAGVSLSLWATSSNVNAYFGWRPVLELI